MTHNLFTVRQPSAALNEPLEIVRPAAQIRQPATPKASRPAKTAAPRSPLTLLAFAPKLPKRAPKSVKVQNVQKIQAKSAPEQRTVYSSTTQTSQTSQTLNAAPIIKSVASAVPDAPIMSKPIEMRNTANVSRTTSSRSRIIAMSGLCLLLVISGAWAAISRPSTNVVGLPVTIRQPLTAQVTAAPVATPTPGGEGETTLTTLNSFITYKQQMDAARDQSIAMLDALIADVNADATTLEQARGEKLALAKSIATEATLQGLMSARGFGDSYITVRPGSVNVVVKQEKLTSQQMASILEMVTAETGESPDSVKIILTK
ncbi:hypothetical protein AGMMS49992_12840 [Clostridia bacterium]|nr:hypothetical protein AGMMS49992_12840 [Clostridia bacterium]